MTSHRHPDASRPRQEPSDTDTVLITFLGTGAYHETIYHWRDHGIAAPTPFVACALAELTDATTVHVLATSQAVKANGTALMETLAQRSIDSRIHPLRTGRNDDGRWQQFQVLADLIRDAAKQSQAVVLDITHGFRAQPFFAGAVLDVLVAAGIRPNRLSVVYGEHQPDGQSTIWDLTQFIEVIEWAQALAMFTRTGFAGPMIELGRRMRRMLAERKQAGELDHFPGFGPLIDAIEGFADDLATVRVASIITGYAQQDDKKEAAKGSAQRLLDTIDQHRKELAELVPPLALVVDELADVVRPLIAEHLASTHGQQALQALVHHYLQREHYPEAMIVLREARVCSHADDERGIEVNSPTFSDDHRKMADQRFAVEDPDARTIAAIRNDIEHGGFRKQPLAADKLKKHAHTLYRRPPRTAQPVRQPICCLVSRHPGALEWLRARGIEAERTVDHLDPETPEPGDVVIGTLPLHIAARLSERGVRFQFLALDLPPELRGRELSLEEMNTCNARLEEYRIQRVDLRTAVRSSTSA